MKKEKAPKTYDEKAKKLNRAHLRALLFCYVVILLWIIVFKCNVNSTFNIEGNLAQPLLEKITRGIIPFRDIYIVLFKKFSLLSFISFIFNFIICIPGGMLLGFFVGKRKGLLISTVFILCVEIFQMLSGWGIFDVTDVIMNDLGVYVGYLIHDALYKRLSAKAINNTVKITMIAAIVMAISVTVNTVFNFPV